MELSYIIGQIVNCNFLINVNLYNTKDKINYKINYEVDLVNKFSNYKFVNNNYHQTQWYFTMKKKDKITEKNKKFIKGDIIIYDIEKLNKRNLKSIYLDSMEFKSSKQSEYDKYLYCLDKKCDNAKLYQFIYKKIIEENKKEFIEENKPKLKETSFRYFIV